MRKIFFILIVLFSLMMSACRSVTCGITEADVIHDTTYIAKHSRDSVYVHDSVFFEKIFKDDTLIVREKYFHNYYVGEAVHDTIYKSKTDTLIQIETVEVEKPRTASFWETVGNILIGCAVGMLLFFAGRFYREK